MRIRERETEREGVFRRTPSITVSTAFKPRAIRPISRPTNSQTETGRQRDRPTNRRTDGRTDDWTERDRETDREKEPLLVSMVEQQQRFLHL